MTHRLSAKIAWLPLSIGCLGSLPAAQGVERIGDATDLYDLAQYAASIAALEEEFLSLVATASDNERFGLYWTYNHLTGAKVQVDLLQSQLQASIAVPPHMNDELARTTLREQAEFVAWDLDNAIADLEHNVPQFRRSSHSRALALLRSLLSAARATVSHLAAG